MFKDLAYSLKQAGQSVWRNKGMSIASTFSITAMLLILAVVLALTVNINYMTETVKTQFDTVEVFLNDDALEASVTKLTKELEGRDEVTSVTYITKDEAMEEFKVKWGDSSYLLDTLAENPLPNSLRVELAELQYGSAIKSIAQSYDCVEDVRFYADEVNKVLSITNTIQKGALVIIIFLVIVSVVVVSNTVKLTVMARREEIIIMKYVGATNWFIRGPLLLEGMIIGLVSAALSLGISGFVYYKLCLSLGEEAMLLFSTALVDPKFMIVNFIWIFVSLGVSIGAFGSILSMRKFLKA